MIHVIPFDHTFLVMYIEDCEGIITVGVQSFKFLADAKAEQTKRFERGCKFCQVLQMKIIFKAHAAENP